jgi:hypothetical protein
VVRLAEYLLRQGYRGSEITILTTYQGDVSSVLPRLQIHWLTLVTLLTGQRRLLNRILSQDKYARNPEFKVEPALLAPLSPADNEWSCCPALMHIEHCAARRGQVPRRREQDRAAFFGAQ